MKSISRVEMSATTILPHRTCWVAVRGAWLRSICNSCRLLYLRAPEPARSRKIQLPSLSMLSRGARGASLLPRAGSRGISVRTTCHRDELEKQHMSEEETTSFEKENIWTVPNVLSLSRVLLSPVLGYQILHGSYLMAFGLLTVAAISDVVDGQIARRYPSQSSMLGSVLDPVADKCLISILCITLTIQGIIPLPLTVLILSRDALLIGVGLYLRFTTLPPPRTWSRYWDIQRSTLQVTPSSLSKVNTLLQLMTVGLSLGATVVDAAYHPLLQILWLMTAASTVASGGSYIIQMKGFKVLRKRVSNLHKQT